MNSETHIFDIETAALPESELAHVMPKFSAPANYKDPEKIAANVEEQRKAWVRDASLSPITGKVLCIGLRRIGGYPPQTRYLEGDEETILNEFWQQYVPDRTFINLLGWNIESFDLPFLIRRSWKHRIQPPMARIFSGRYLSSRWTDLMKVFQAGAYREPFTSLETAGRFLGLGGKLGDGEHFAEVYANDPKMALAYLYRDLELTDQICSVIRPMASDPRVREEVAA